jgi:hypothetical protein
MSIRSPALNATLRLDTLQLVALPVIVQATPLTFAVLSRNCRAHEAVPPGAVVTAHRIDVKCPEPTTCRKFASVPLGVLPLIPKY